MSLYLNKIGLLKYNNTSYQQVGLILYYSVRDPALVSSDPRIDFFSYPWKSDEHWIYNKLNLGWYYNGQEDIAFTFTKEYSDLSSYNPRSILSNNIPKIVHSGFLYNIIPILLFLLTTVVDTNGEINNSLFEYPLPMYYLSTFDGNLHLVNYDNDYRAYFQQTMNGEGLENNITVSAYTYEIAANRTPIVIDWVPSSVSLYESTIGEQSNIGVIVSGVWTNDLNPLCGILYNAPRIHLGSINDIFSNEIQFEVKSPNISGAETSAELCSNLVNGLFTNIPGTDYITGICTTKMFFLDNQYVYMRGLVKGNIEVLNGILLNEVASPSTIIKKVKIKHLQGTLKNITELPDEVKYGLNYYYAWGWLHGIDNIKYENIWYKNEISGNLKTSTGSEYSEESEYYNRYTGVLSVPIITNNGTEDITNIVTGMFYKEEGSNIITGNVEGVIEPFSIRMKGYLTGYYSIVNKTILKPLQLGGTLYNKSAINLDLRQILDIKYANTLGRKGLTYPDPLYGKRLNFATKNYNPHNHPYMLLTWKIIEYKTSTELEEVYTTSKDVIDLNTYIADNKYIQQNYKSRIHKTKDLLSNLSGSGYYVYWYRDEQTGDFVIKGTKIDTDLPESHLSFKDQVAALKYIKHMCGLSNLKLKQYIDLGDTTSYILESSDMDIR